MNSRSITTPIMQRVKENTIKTEAGCLEWQGNLDNKGYARGQFNDKTRLVHREVLKFVTKKNPSVKTFALHKCDNPKCINPDHLYWGTAQDNSNDIFARGRRKTKINSIDVMWIKEMHKIGIPRTRIGKIFSIDQSYVLYICNGRTIHA